MKISLKKYFRTLEKPDILNQIFLAFITLVILFNYDKIPGSLIYIIVNIFLALVIVFVTGGYAREKFQTPAIHKSLKIFRYWYPILTIIFYFKEIYMIMISLQKNIFDIYLINIDKIIFGANPTEVLSKIANPYLTEFLQIIYLLFYILPVIYGLELYLWKRYEEFKYAMFLILLGFYLSFIGYLILPAVGPRFTLHDFSKLSFELPGLWLTDTIRTLINYGESIYPSEIGYAINVAQRDAFPSGHTIIIVCITYMSYKFRSKSFYFYLPYMFLMMFATIYLRYHYVIDVFSGILIGIISILIANYTFRNKNLSPELNRIQKNI